MKKDLLLIIDMQNVYAAGGAWCCPGAEAAAGNIHELISSSGQDLDVIFTGFIAGSNPKGTWKDYNREYADINNDDHANAMMDVFREDLKKYPLYTKSVYSSLDIPEVREAVKKADRVLVAGYYYNGRNKPSFYGAVYEHLDDDLSCEGTIGLREVSEVVFSDEGHAIQWAMSQK